jgi:hypothetical protein
MARARQQRGFERLIPCEVYEANEARRRARRDRGVDSDVSTVGDASEASGRNNDPEDPENEATLGDTIEEVLRQSTITMFRRVLVFNDGAATSLYDDQMITTFDVCKPRDP